MSNDLSLERAATPEEVGVDSNVVQDFVNKAIEMGKEFHSLMVIRHGKVACEVYREPFNANSVHMMYSVSKSITATAIGLAIDEGIMSLETKFLDVYPEFRNEKKPDAFLEELSVANLLSMQGGKSITPFMSKSKDTWLKAFVDSGWYAEPGTEFRYINENMYVLCRMLSKLSGQTVTEFLEPRLYEPLGIETPFWETDPSGHETGGWGLMLKTEDFAKITFCYQQNGKYKGKQVIPEWWVKEVQTIHANSADNSKQPDACAGYTYGFWRCAGYENAYRMDGMYSQFGIIFEDLDACLVTTSGEIQSQPYKDLLWQYFPKAFNDDADPKNTVEVKAEPYPKLPASKRPKMEKQLDCRRITFSKPLLLNAVGMPVSVVTLPALYMEKDRAGNINNLSFKFYDNEGMLLWTEGDEINAVRFGLDGEYRWDYMYIGGTRYETCSIACWNNPRELEVHIRSIATVSERIMVFKFDGKGKVLLLPSSMPTIYSMQTKLQDSLNDVLASETLKKFTIKYLPKVLGMVDAKHYGTIG